MEVKKIVLYECPICHLRYDKREWAEDCVARGAGKEYPIGTIYGDTRPGAFYENITLCVAENRIERHLNAGSSWACRDTGMGDSIGDSMCAGNSLTLGESDHHVDPSTPHFQRMVKFLRSRQIDIHVWDGKEAVTYGTFLKRFKEGTWY